MVFKVNFKYIEKSEDQPNFQQHSIQLICKIPVFRYTHRRPETLHLKGWSAFIYESTG